MSSLTEEQRKLLTSLRNFVRKERAEMRSSCCRMDSLRRPILSTMDDDGRRYDQTTSRLIERIDRQLG